MGGQLTTTQTRNRELLKQARLIKRDLSKEDELWDKLRQFHSILNEWDDTGKDALYSKGCVNYLEDAGESFLFTLTESASYAPNRLISIDEQDMYEEFLEGIDDLKEEFGV